MAFNVRIFGIAGVQPIPVIGSKQFSSDSIFQLILPPLFRQVLVADAVAVPSAPDATVGVNLLRVEIPAQQAIRYEITAAGVVRAADNTSMRIEGTQHLYFKPGWTISIIDAAGLP